jgi:hypothetical protein
MSERKVIPLFILPMGLFPLTEEPLRVFEPRYKQMLDDCLLDNLPFGYVAANQLSEDIDGWTPPSEYGVLTIAENVSEQGTNLLFTACGKTRFKILKIIPAALPAEEFNEVFPSVDELVELYSVEYPDGKLYVRAEIEVLPALKGIIESRRWENLVISWTEHVINMNSIIGGYEINIEEILPIMKNEFIPYDESKLWGACQSILDSQKLRQSALAAYTSEEILELLENSLKEKTSQIEMIDFMIGNEEE